MFEGISEILNRPLAKIRVIPKETLARSSHFVVLILLFFTLSLISPHFLTITNLINVLRQASLLLILATGMTTVILTAGIDLSMGSVLALSSSIAATFLKMDIPMLVGVFIGLVIGTFCGLVNGLMVAKVGLPPFIATFGTMWVARGLVMVYMKGYIIYGFNLSFRFLGAGYILGIPTPIIIAGLVFTVFYFILYYTTLGRSVYAVGANRSAAELSGIKVERVLIAVYMLSGFMAAFGGLIYISRLNAAECGIGELFHLQAIAAALVGGTTFRGGEGGIAGTVMGALIMTMVTNIMNILGISSLWQTFVLGAIIVLAVLGDQFIARRFA